LQEEAAKTGGRPSDGKQVTGWAPEVKNFTETLVKDAI
jgi:hypothetical protein